MILWFLDRHPRIAKELFEGEQNIAESKLVPRMIAGPCCSQFITSREAVLSRSKDFYIYLYQAIEEGVLHRFFVGRVMEYLWAPILGQRAVLTGKFIETGDKLIWQPSSAQAL